MDGNRNAGDARQGFEAVAARWLSHDRWSLEAASYLLSGAIPPPAAKQPNQPDVFDEVGRPGGHVGDMWDRLRRSMFAGTLHGEGPPSDYIAWALFRGLAIPAALHRIAEQFSLHRGHDRSTGALSIGRLHEEAERRRRYLLDGEMTIEEAAIELADANGVSALTIVEDMLLAWMDRKLTVRRPGTGIPYAYSSKARTFADIVRVAEVDRWLESVGARYRFPAAPVPENETPPTAAGNGPALDLAAEVAKHGSMRATARALGMPWSTFRRRLGQANSPESHAGPSRKPKVRASQSPTPHNPFPK